MSGTGCKPHPAVMPAEMRVTETMTAEMAATMMTTAMPAAAMSTTVPAAMSATMATAAMSALRQRRARQHAGKHHCGNSNDRSQHRILPKVPRH
ncbi:hypothetical protein [Bradyrhizobium sp. UFLA05-112]